MVYLSSNSLLHSTQSGFRPNHSFETSLLNMINKWLDAINSSQIIGMVMTDFRKAFDLVDPALMLKKTQILQNIKRDYPLVSFLSAR